MNDKQKLQKILPYLRRGDAPDSKYPTRKGEYWTLCPFHDDRHAKNFSVSERGYNCFTCGASGGLNQLAEKLGVTFGDNGHKGKGDGFDFNNVVARYTYHDAEGNEVYQVWKDAKKDFLPNYRRGGEQRYGYPPEGRVLYRLHEIGTGEPVYLVEGEKSANALRALGLTATAIPGGARATWFDSYTEALAGRDVVIFPDNDDAGRRFAERAAEKLKGAAASVKVVEVPGLEKGQDIEDWIDQGHGADDVAALPDNALREAFERLARREEADFVQCPRGASLGVVSTGDLLASDIEPPGHIVENMIPAGELTFVVSDGGIGKSWLLLALAETLSNAGQSFLGNECGPCNVVYLDMELSAAWYANRVRMVDAGLASYGAIQGRDDRWDTYYLESPPVSFDDARDFLQRLPDLDGTPQRITSFDYLRAVIEQTGAWVLIIDPIANLWGDVDENAASETAAVCEALKAVARSTGAAVVVAHHTNKGRIEERGSTAIRNNAAAMYTMTWAKDQPVDDLRKFETSKARHSRALDPMYLAFSWEDGAFTVKRYHQSELEKLRAEQEEAKADVYAREVADVVRSAGSWALNKSDLIDRLTEADMSRRGAEEAIERAEELGLIESEKQGRARLFALAGEGNGGQK